MSKQCRNIPSQAVLLDALRDEDANVESTTREAEWLQAERDQHAERAGKIRAALEVWGVVAPAHE